MSSLFLNNLANTRLYPLTDRRLSGLSHAEQVAHLSKGGATLVQLREKILSSFEFYREAAEAVCIARERRVKIIINDRVDIALALKADGVHLGQDDLPAEDARKLLGPEVIIGFSTHNLEQAFLSTKMPIDYIAIGPIFSTATKQSSEPPLGLDGLSQVRQAVPEIPLVAIGGITSQNSQAVLDAGADAIAVISDIWNVSGQVAAHTEILLHRI
ncbi:MAG: thiamine phosphate synthase [Pyrinomonadaceae bacterium]